MPGTAFMDEWYVTSIIVFRKISKQSIYDMVFSDFKVLSHFFTSWKGPVLLTQSLK